MTQISLVLASLFVTTAAFAQSSSISVAPPPAASSETTAGELKSEIKSVLGNKQFEADKDITDPKLQADLGSLSRYSLKFNLTYNGPPVGDLNNQYQPNPDSVVSNNETAIGGSINARYRYSPKSTISIGTGVSALTPIQGAKEYNVKNPFISFDRSDRFGSLQMRNSIGASVVTVPVYRKVSEYAGISLDNSLVNNIGTSGWALSLDTSLAYYLFSRDYEKKDGRINRSGISFYPGAKYNFNDKFSANTSVALMFWNPRSERNETILWNRTISQRLGLGYAFTRDIYVAPYLNFYPKSLNSDLTTINISTTFSIL